MTSHDGAGSANRPIRVVIVDDQSMARIGVKQILSLDKMIEVVGEGSNGVEAISLTQSLHPDVVLMDVRMPLLDGIGATERICGGSEIDPKPHIVMLTTFNLDEYVFGALKAGAAGFLLKDLEPADLIRAIKTVVKGDSLIAPAVTKTLVQAALGLNPKQHRVVAVSAASQRNFGELSEREREVLVCLAQGLSNAQLAERLFVSETTIKTHVSSVLSKLHLNSRVQAVIYAYENGLIRPG